VQCMGAILDRVLVDLLLVEHVADGWDDGREIAHGEAEGELDRRQGLREEDVPAEQRDGEDETRAGVLVRLGLLRLAVGDGEERGRQAAAYCIQSAYIFRRNCAYREYSQAGTSSRKMPKKATLVRRLAIRYTVFSSTMPTKKKA
jgi:hypothetical protein